jgi:hypothetical protein
LKKDVLGRALNKPVFGVSNLKITFSHSIS